METNNEALRELRVDGNKILINEFKEEVGKVAEAAYGLEANDMIGEDYDIFVALSEKETPNQFVERVGKRMDLDSIDGFQFPKMYRVQAEMISYCYIDIEAVDEEAANEIAEETDGVAFYSDDDPHNGSWRRWPTGWPGCSRTI